jgi:hypothetical protein
MYIVQFWTVFSVFRCGGGVEIFSLIHFWCATYYKINPNPEVRINPKIKAKNETPYCSRQRSVLVTAWVRDILRLPKRDLLCFRTPQH